MLLKSRAAALPVRVVKYSEINAGTERLYH
jgi:hypothetical protein